MNITDVLQTLNIPYCESRHRHVRHGFAGIDCPTCSPNSEKWKLGINLRTLFTSCWTCGPSPLAWTLSQVSGQPYAKVKDLFSGLQRDLVFDRPQAAGRLTLPNGIGPMLKPHRDYLKGRGFDPSYLEKVWGVQGIALAKNLSWRLFIPIKTGGKTVSWTTRSLSGEGVRYISAKADQEIVSKKSILYGEDFVGHAVVVCEGPTDVWKIGLGAVATLGVNYSRSQVKRLSRYPVRIVCMDNEPIAQERARKLCRELECFPGEVRNVVLSSKDPGSGSEQEIRELRRMLQ